MTTPSTAAGRAQHLAFAHPGCEFCAAVRADPDFIEAEARQAAPLDVERVRILFEGEIGDRLYFWGATYGYPEGESTQKIAEDFAAAYAAATTDEEGATDV